MSLQVGDADSQPLLAAQSRDALAFAVAAILLTHERVEVVDLERSLASLPVAVDLGQHPAQRRRLVPLAAQLGVRRFDQVAQLPGPRIKSRDPGRLSDQLPDVNALSISDPIFRTALSSAASNLASVLSLLISAAAFAIIFAVICDAFA